METQQKRLYQHGVQILTRIAEAIFAKDDALCDYIDNDHFVRSDDFEEDNPYSRKLFVEVTHIPLPAHRKDVRAVLINYVGEKKWSDYWNRKKEKMKRDAAIEYRKYIAEPKTLLVEEWILVQKN